MDNNRDLVEQLYSDLKGENAFIKVTPAGNISINEEKVGIKNALQFLQGRVRLNPSLDKLLMLEVNSFLSLLRIVHGQATRQTPDYKEVQVGNYDFNGLIPFQSVTDASRHVLFDSKLGTVTDLDFDTFKNNRDTARIEPIKARIEFNPYSPKQIDYRKDHYGRPCNFLNTYKKPAWQYERELLLSEVATFRPPQVFTDFMCHLFPDKECRTYVLDWLHYALTDRCETYLVLNGAKGIGKNLFSENLCKPLMGTHNHKIAQPSALESNFNALLKECRMIVFDEFRIDTPEKVNKLKRYVNEEQMIERKGIDVSETTKTYNSFIISNNDMADMKISWDDRRFSVADLTKAKLADAWTTSKINELLHCLRDDEHMRNIGYFLMYRKPKYTKFDAYKKRHFYDLCYSSFAEWQKCIIDMAVSKGYREITHADLKKEYRKRTEVTRLPTFAKIKDFVENYRHDGEYSLGEAFKVTGGDIWSIVLSEKFAALEEEDNQDWSQLL